jgi:hypothetical protein
VTASAQRPVSVLEADGLRTFIWLRSGAARAVDGVSFAVEPGESVGWWVPEAAWQFALRAAVA